MIPNIKAGRSIFYHSLITGILVFIGTLAILALLTTVMTNRLGSHIFPNVYINSYNVGNLTKDQASKLISRSNAPFAKTLSLSCTNRIIATLCKSPNSG